MDTSWRNHVIALAGMLQALALVEQLAKTGYLKTDELETAVRSLFNTQPESAIAVFGQVKDIHLGLESLENLLTHYTSPENSDLLRYMIGVMNLEKMLSKKKDVMNTISNRLTQAQQQSEHFDLTHENVIANIASIYEDTLSKFRYRIQVSGNANYLQQSRVASQVRTLLFASVRSCMLWQQVGGSRWQIVFYRKKLLEHCQALIRESNTNVNETRH